MLQSGRRVVALAQENALRRVQFTGSNSKLFRGLVIAGRPARLAIHQPIVAHPNVDDGLAQNTIFFAHTIRFGLLALCATEFGSFGTRTHEMMLFLEGIGGNVTPVTCEPW